MDRVDASDVAARDSRSVPAHRRSTRLSPRASSTAAMFTSRATRWTNRESSSIRRATIDVSSAALGNAQAAAVPPSAPISASTIAFPRRPPNSISTPRRRISPSARRARSGTGKGRALCIRTPVGALEAPGQPKRAPTRRARAPLALKASPPDVCNGPFQAVSSRSLARAINVDMENLDVSQSGSSRLPRRCSIRLKPVITANL